MQRRKFIQAFGASIAAGYATSARAIPKKPNMVFIIADDCTYRDIGCYGGQAYTPNIDKLATEGMLFTQCFQAAPMCSPTRHNIYTGQYPVKTGAYPNHTHVNPGVKSIVHYLKPLGYRVAQTGKKHIGPREAFPFEYLSTKDNNPDFEAVDAFFADCQKKRNPFCIFICSNEPHSPWNKGDPSRYDADKLKLPPYFVDTPETREAMTRYLAEITYFDGQVGEALDLIDKYGFRDNTLVIVVSEQGSSFPFGKWTCYDTGLQSAFIARWPGKIKPGTVNHALIEYVDIAPTFVEVAGGTPAPELDGKSLLPVFAGKQEHKKYVYGEMTTRGINNGSDYFGIRSIRSKQFKYIWNFTPEMEFKNAGMSSEVFKSWVAKAEAGDADAAEKVRRYKHRPAEELYDITKDPYEWNNLANNPEYAKIKAELRAELKKWMEYCGDKGQQTELEALEHMSKARREKKNAGGGIKKGEGKKGGKKKKKKKAAA